MLPKYGKQHVPLSTVTRVLIHFFERYTQCVTRCKLLHDCDTPRSKGISTRKVYSVRVHVVPQLVCGSCSAWKIWGIASLAQLGIH